MTLSTRALSWSGSDDLGDKGEGRTLVPQSRCLTGQDRHGLPLAE